MFDQPYKQIANSVRAGRPLIEIQQEHGVKTIVDILTHYAPTLYEVNMRLILQVEMHKNLPGWSATPNELAQHVAKYQRDWDSKPTPADAPTVYLDELFERSTEEFVSTGIALIDNRVGSIGKGRLTVIGARPSVGKSAFTLQVAFDVARKGKKVLYLPLEMTTAETIDRVVLRFSESVTGYDLKRGRLDDLKRREMMDVLETVSSLQDKEQFLIYEGVNQISRIRHLIDDLKPDMVVIDQLSQIQPKSAQIANKSVRERYVEITRELKEIALSERTAIWLPVQMNRESSKSGMVSIDYLKESGSIEEDADIVILLANAKDEQGEPVTDGDGRILDIEIAKNRMGACGKEQIRFNPRRFRFENLVQDGFEEVITNVPF